jgi:hypothetical protein
LCTRGFVTRIHGFVSYRDQESWLQKSSQIQILTVFEKIRFVESICDHKSSKFSKIQPVFTNPMNSWIFSTIAQNKSLKIWICRLANPDSLVWSLKIWFVDLFQKNKNPKMLVLYQFVVIRPQIPQPWINLNRNFKIKITHYFILNIVRFLWMTLMQWLLFHNCILVIRHNIWKLL